MSKYPNISEETAAAQHREALETRPQDRYAGRLKFTGCRECGSDFGMYSADREAIAKFLPGAIERFAPWYRELDNNLVLYYRCWTCNFGGGYAVPDNLKPLGIEAVLEWFNRDPMAPDYAALTSEDSRDAAGTEG